MQKLLILSMPHSTDATSGTGATNAEGRKKIHSYHIKPITNYLCKHQRSPVSCTRLLIKLSRDGHLLILPGPPQSLRPSPSSSPFLRKPPLEEWDELPQARGTRIRMPVNDGRQVSIHAPLSQTRPEQTYSWHCGMSLMSSSSKALAKRCSTRSVRW
jgi:hypothetical protein